EIAPLLRPMDLLQVSRANKVLRSVLLSRSNRRMWSAALARIPDLPPCPNDMSEPCYTALIFDSHCFHCGVDRAYSVDYFLRVRLCCTCYSMRSVYCFMPIDAHVVVVAEHYLMQCARGARVRQRIPVFAWGFGPKNSEYHGGCGENTMDDPPMCNYDT
ncbi:hypothetical protein C8Q78DRAFT_986087, partial [Trametes maxima]